MVRAATTQGPPRGGRFQWRSGGWVVLLAVLLVLAASAWRIVPMLRSPGGTVGDGRTVESYEFDLDPLLVEPATLVAAGFPRDGVAPIDAPSLLQADEVARFNEEHRGKYLVDDDRVIGLVVGHNARAYPERVMNWHEIVNDELGGIPVAVTYHPLCDSVAVFDRRVQGETLEFGVSGLLSNSNLLMYDRARDETGSSLWSQLQARAVAGPAAAAGLRLAPLPVSRTDWGSWKRMHPGTTVLRPEESKLKRYRRNPYGNYLHTGKLRFPVAPQVSGDTRGTMARILVILGAPGSVPRAYALDGEIGAGSVGFENGLRLAIEREEQSVSVHVDAPGDSGLLYSAWFAWHAQYPGIEPQPLALR